MNHILETSRLKLRELESGDLDFIAEMLGNPDVMNYWPKSYSREEAKEWLLKQRERYQEHGFGYWLVLEKKMKQPVGQVGLMKTEIEGEEEIALGYIIHQPFWRKGYAFEAASACINYGFKNLKAERVISLIRPENEPSQKVAQKLKMKPVGIKEFVGFKHLIFMIHNEDID